MHTVRLSSKGQVIIPKALRERQKWQAGQEFIVEQLPEGLLLRPQPLFPSTTTDQVFGCLNYEGPPRSIEEMDRAVERSASERWAQECSHTRSTDS